MELEFFKIQPQIKQEFPYHKLLILTRVHLVMYQTRYLVNHKVKMMRKQMQSQQQQRKEKRKIIDMQGILVLKLQN